MAQVDITDLSVLRHEHIQMHRTAASTGINVSACCMTSQEQRIA